MVQMRNKFKMVPRGKSKESQPGGKLPKKTRDLVHPSWRWPTQKEYTEIREALRGAAKPSDLLILPARWQLTRSAWPRGGKLARKIEKRIPLTEKEYAALKENLAQRIPQPGMLRFGETYGIREIYVLGPKGEKIKKKVVFMPSDTEIILAPKGA